MNCAICGADLPEGAMFCGECGSSTSATPESRRPVDPRPGDTYVLHRSESGVISVPVPPAPDTAAPVESPAPAAAPEPAAASWPAEPRPAGEHGEGATPSASWEFRFTTGEVVTVGGSGLVGRRPMPQPGERFAHLVQIVDRGLSVSKTHLEFGEHEGRLWVADRFSSNGTVVRRPGEAGVRCEPGRRVLVPRGSQVEIGEQAFTVD
ncbi:FHA domain-containing protein [Agromyces arachidis]|uniref:FHA domain-containing protein n=1 Tax=Agromyces arachidis TaxID=766966 RepID=UPI0040561D6F